MTRVIFVLFFTVLLTNFARAGEIIEGDAADAMVINGSVNPGDYNTLFTLNVGDLSRSPDIGAVVEAFELPYLAPGQKVTSATISFYMEQDNTKPTNTVQLYGLNRVSTNSAPLASDWYTGANDKANTLLDSTFAMPSTTLNQAVTYSGSNLASFVQTQYANSAFSGMDLSPSRFIFFRLSANGTEYGTNNYQFASSRNPTRSYHPTLALTISNGISDIKGRFQFSFDLPQNSITSAGVYNDTTGVLVRTLWNNIQYLQGTNYGVWDGNDDSGKPLPAGTPYKIKLIHHNVQYVWQGIVGNTSASQTGTNVYRGYLFMEDMTIAGNTAYYTLGYNENENPFHSFVVGQPQVPSEIQYGYSNAFSSMNYVTSDGIRCYWAKCAGGINPSYTYVVATNCKTGAFYTFPRGTTPVGFGQYPSCLDYDGAADQPNGATGLAVQQSGNDVFVSHANLNVVRVFDKVQGNLLGSFSVPSPGTLHTTANGDVWVISNAATPVVKRYTFANGKATLDETITGLVDPVSLGVSADDSLLLVADGGASGQIKAFKNATGAAAWTYGALGGMAVNGPSITSNAFDFTSRTYIAFQADNTFWIGDQGDSRVLHFSINGNTLVYIEQIAFQGASYQSTVDLTDPTRVFNQFLEYSVNYALPVGGTNGSWTLVKNWLYGLPNDATHNYIGFNNGFRNVVTLPNGHTYGFLTNFAPDGGTSELFELSAHGPARNTGYSYINMPRLYEDGTLRFNDNTATSITFYSQPLTGFDAKNNPAWGSPALLASSPLASGDPVPWVAYPMRTEVTANNTVIDFDAACQDGANFHLAGVSVGGKSWSWRSSPSTTTAYTGWFPQDGHFDIGNGVQYAGDYDMALGRNIIYGYHGEFWKGGEASQWVNFLDNGLMVGRFGTYGSLGTGVGDESFKGFAGNAIGPTLVHGPDGNTYLYHNDEGNHGGTLRWLISGWDGITQLNGPASVGAAVNLSPTSVGPVISLTAPTAGAAYLNGSTVLMSANAGGNGAAITGVQFFDGSTSLGTVTMAPYNLSAPGLSFGPHVVRAVATDANGLSATSALVEITVGGDGSNTPPPTPISLSANNVVAHSVGLNWTEPAMSTSSSTIGQIMSFQMDTAGDSGALAPSAMAGAPSYNVAHFNLLGHVNTSGVIMENPLNSLGVAIPNLGVDTQMQFISNGNSTALMSGTTATLFGNENTTQFSPATAITLSNIPYAWYDVVIYSLPPSLNSHASSTSVSVSDSVTSTTVAQSLTKAPTGYTVATIPFGSNNSGVDADTIVIQGLTSPIIRIQGGNIAAFQIVERPYDQGTPNSFSIQRAPGTSGTFATVGTAQGTVSSFTDTSNLNGNTSYQYRVRATNGFGSSAYSNTVSVTTEVSTTPLAGFSSWQAQYFTPAQLGDAAISGPSANPYGSSVPNLLAYALQLNPATAQPSDLPQAVLKNGHQEITYFVPSAINDVNYIVEVSSNLQTWNSGNGYTEIISNVASANGNTITVQNALSNPKSFIRLRVTEQGGAP